MALDWTTMVNQVVIAGRPADVEDAALGWQELIGNVRDVCTSLEQDIKGIDAFWTGKAADAFARAGHGREQGAQEGLGQCARPRAGRASSTHYGPPPRILARLRRRCRSRPSMLGELMAARDARITLAPGLSRSSSSPASSTTRR